MTCDFSPLQDIPPRLELRDTQTALLRGLGATGMLQPPRQQAALHGHSQRALKCNQRLPGTAAGAAPPLGAETRMQHSRAGNPQKTRAFFLPFTTFFSSPDILAAACWQTAVPRKVPEQFKCCYLTWM